MKISDKIKQLQAINIEQIVDDSLRENEKEIIALNQEQLYDKGQIDVKNPSVRQYYAPATIAQKKKKARYPKTDFITLRWMGDLYDKMKMIIFRDYFVVTTDDLKWANWLEPRFGNALGLTDESVKKVRDIVLPGIFKRLRA
jgi:hypothetical protein